MTSNNVGNRYNYYYMFNENSNLANGNKYDYKRKGLLSKLMSPLIVASNNRFVKTIYYILEDSLIFLLDYTEDLKNFKNFTNRNR